MKPLPTPILRTSFQALLALCITPLFAADRTWDGGGADAAWLTPLNWNADLAPAPNDTLFFDGTLGLATSNNFGAGTGFNGITFNAGAGAFTLAGNLINLNGNIVNHAADVQTITLPMYLGSSTRTIDIDASSTLNINSTISAYIGNGIVKAGAGRLNIGVPQGYLGPTTVNAGVLAISGGGTTYGNSASTIFTVNNGARLRFDRNDAFGAAAAQTGVSIVINEGGVVDNGAFYTLIPILTLNGGELRVNDGLNNAGYQTYQLREVNVGGTVASKIAGTPTVTGLNKISLGDAAVTSNVIFNVGDVTANADADLTVSAIFQNMGSGAATSITKRGAGTMVLSAANTYTGTTNIAGGTLTVDGTAGSLAAASSVNFAGTGTFHYQGAAAGSTQTFTTGLGTTAGEGTLRVTYGGAGDTALVFGALNGRNVGATMNIELVGGITTGATPSNKISFTTLPPANVFLDRGFFFGGSNYAAYDTNGYLRAADYATDADGVISAGGADLGAVSASSQVLLTGNVTAQPNAAVRTIKIAGNQNITLGGGQTLQVNGILKTGNVAGGSTISGGAGIRSEDQAELIFRTDGVNDSLNINTPILAAATAGISKNGAGTLTLNGVNTYTGATTVNNGNLNIASSGSTYAGAMVVAGGTLSHLAANNFTGAVTITGGTLNQNAASTYSGAGVRNVTDGTLNMAGTNTFTGDININAGGVLNVPAAATAPSAGVFNLQRNGTANINGSVTVKSPNINGNMVLNGTMNTVSNAYIFIGNGVNNNGGTFGNVGTLTMNAGSQFNVSGGFSVDTLVIGRDGGTGTVNQNGGTFDYNAIGDKKFIVGAGAGALGIYNLNAGLLDLHGQTLWVGIANSTGFFNLNGGTLRTTQVSTTGQLHGIFNFNGGTLQLNGAAGSLINTIEAARVQAGGAIIDTAGFDGAIPSGLQHDPALGATADGGLHKRGTGTLTLTGGNSYTGATIVEAGTLAFAGGGTVLNSSASPISVESGATLLFSRNDVFGVHSANPLTPITIKEGATMTNSGAFVNVLGPVTLSGGTLTSTSGLNADLPAWGLKANVFVNGAVTSTISSGSPTGGIALGEAEISSTTFTVADGAAATDLFVSAKIQNSGTAANAAIQTPSTLVKAGPGTMSLSAVNVYTGPTQVNEGKLVLTSPGSIATSSLTTVASGAELSGDGTAGPLAISGKLSPGSGLGILNSGAATFADASTLSLEIGGTSSDQLNAAGSVTLNGAIGLQIALLSDPTDLTSFTILNSTGLSGTGHFAYGLNVLDEGERFTVTSNSFTQDFTISYTADNNQDVVITAVPEPGSALMLLAGLGIAASARRRRQR